MARHELHANLKMEVDALPGLEQHRTLGGVYDRD